MPESVRWLISKGKLKRAEEIVVKIASYNSLRLDRSWLRQELERVSRNLELQMPIRQPDIRDVFTNRRIRKHAFAMFFIW